MNEIERFSKSKTGRVDDCEDGIFVSDDFVGVIDGATSKSERRFSSGSAGRKAMELMVEVLSGLAARATVDEFVSGATSRIARFYTEGGLWDMVRAHPESRLTASAVVFSAYRRQLWFVGDCQALIDGRYVCFPKKVDSVVAEARAMFLNSRIRLGQTVEELKAADAGRQFVMPLLVAQSVFQNAGGTSEYDYGVLDGFGVASNHVMVVPVPEGAREIVLASDGYPELGATLAESEALLERQLLADPLCISKFKSTKGLALGAVSFDDRSYVRVSL